MGKFNDLLERMREFKKWNPVREEIVGKRNLDFSKWLRKHGRPSSWGFEVDGEEFGGFTAFDLDFVLYDYRNQKMQVLEVKTHSGIANYSQRKTMKVIDAIFGFGCEEAGIEYLGLHYLTLSSTDPANSEYIYWDGKEVSYDEAWCLINMLNPEEFLDG